MSYADARKFLAQHTQLIELTNEAGARVAVAPQWQARVMTSTCGGLEGPSFGIVNREFIEAGQPDPHFNNYGGEDRLWLCPEGGQFSLWFGPGAKQVLENWRTPPALNEQAWNVVSPPGATTLRMETQLCVRNACDTLFELSAAREVRLLSAEDCSELWGPATAILAGQHGAKMVAYETANRITNRGPAFCREQGLVSIWELKRGRS